MENALFVPNASILGGGALDINMTSFSNIIGPTGKRYIQLNKARLGRLRNAIENVG